jgi:spermidine synthase
MGALFSHLFAPLVGHGVGRAYALNTLGGTMAPFLFGLAGLRTLGYAGTLAVVGILYLTLFAAVAFRLPRARGLGWAAGAVTVLGAVLFPRSLRLVAVPAGWELKSEQASLMGLVLVTEETRSSLPRGLTHRRLQVNGRFRMGGSSAFIERRLGHIPLLFAPGAKTALFLGVGTGGTLSAVRHFPLERVEAVELVPEVLAILPWFEEANESVARDPRVRLYAADARRFVAASAKSFDLVVGDLFHPERDGAGSLYSREHFQTVAAHLAPGGVYAQWLPLFQLDLHTLQMIVRTFLEVFPEAHSLVGSYNAETPTLVLLGRTGPAPAADRWPIPLTELRQRLQDPVYTGLELQDPRELLATFMLNREGLRTLAGAAPLNTDLEPHVLFDAPRSAYERPRDQAWHCLAVLLGQRVICPSSLVTADEPGFGEDLARFSRAVGLYLEADVARMRDHGFSAAAVEGYLRSYEAAPEFRPAGGILQMLAESKPRLAEKVRARLSRGAGH